MQMYSDRWIEQVGENEGDPLDAERRLLASMLIEAMKEYVGRMDTLERREAREWISSRSQFPFGFEWCCDMLEINPHRIRTLLDQRGGHVYRSLHNRRKMVKDERDMIRTQEKINRLEAEAAKLRAAIQGVGNSSH